jgi:hypothetical protein
LTRTFEEEVWLNAIRLARFDLLLTLAGLALAWCLFLLAVRFRIPLLIPAVSLIALTSIRTAAALRRWHRVRHVEPGAALRDDALELEQGIRGDSS